MSKVHRQNKVKLQNLAILHLHILFEWKISVKMYQYFIITIWWVSVQLCIHSSYVFFSHFLDISSLLIENDVSTSIFHLQDNFTALITEITNYLCSKTNDDINDGLKNFPTVRKIFKKYNCERPSECICERLFSYAGMWLNLFSFFWIMLHVICICVKHLIGLGFSMFGVRVAKTKQSFFLYSWLQSNLCVYWFTITESSDRQFWVCWLLCFFVSCDHTY